MVAKGVTIVNKLGLHARAAAKFVNVASQFQSDVQLELNGRRVNGKSIMGVMMLAASCGTTVELIVSGTDEEDAFRRLEELIEQRFGESA